MEIYVPHLPFPGHSSNRKLKARLQLIKLYVFLQFLDIVVAKIYLEEQSECTLQAAMGSMKIGRTLEQEIVTTNAWKMYELEIVNIRKLFLVNVITAI